MKAIINITKVGQAKAQVQSKVYKWIRLTWEMTIYQFRYPLGRLRMLLFKELLVDIIKYVRNGQLQSIHCTEDKLMNNLKSSLIVDSLMISCCSLKKPSLKMNH